MSALGQKQTCATHKSMSALTPKADMCGATAHVRFVPKADIAFATKIRTVPIRQKPQLCSQGFLN